MHLMLEVVNMSVVEVLFQENEKKYYFNCKKSIVAQLEKNDRLLVDTKNGFGICIFVREMKRDSFQPGHPTRDVISKL